MVILIFFLPSRDFFRIFSFIQSFILALIIYCISEYICFCLMLLHRIFARLYYLEVIMLHYGFDFNFLMKMMYTLYSKIYFTQLYFNIWSILGTFILVLELYGYLVFCLIPLINLTDILMTQISYLYTLRPKFALKKREANKLEVFPYMEGFAIFNGYESNFKVKFGYSGVIIFHA